MEHYHFYLSCYTAYILQTTYACVIRVLSVENSHGWGFLYFSTFNIMSFATKLTVFSCNSNIYCIHTCWITQIHAQACNYDVRDEEKDVCVKDVDLWITTGKSLYISNDTDYLFQKLHMHISKQLMFKNDSIYLNNLGNFSFCLCSFSLYVTTLPKCGLNSLF